VVRIVRKFTLESNFHLLYSMLNKYTLLTLLSEVISHLYGGLNKRLRIKLVLLLFDIYSSFSIYPVAFTQSCV